MARSKLWGRLMRLRRKALRARQMWRRTIKGQVLLPRPSF